MRLKYLILPLALWGAAASAQTASVPLGNPSKSISLKNDSNHTVVSAMVHTTNGDGNLTLSGDITAGHGRDVALPARSCITSVVVKFKEGNTLRLDNQEECRRTTITVRDETLSLTAADTGSKPE